MTGVMKRLVPHMLSHMPSRVLPGVLPRILPSAMSQRDRRALLVGAVTVLLMVVLSRGLPAWSSWQRRMREDARVARTEAARAEALLGIGRAIEDSLAARDERYVALAPKLLGGESPAAAGATLAGLVSGAAASSGVRVGAVQIRPDTGSTGAFTRVTVRADATGDIRGVTKMLSTLERGPALLAIRSFSIDQPEPAAANDRMEALRVTLEVQGLMLTPRADRMKGDTSSVGTPTTASQSSPGAPDAGALSPSTRPSP